MYSGPTVVVEICIMVLWYGSGPTVVVEICIMVLR